MGWSIESNGVTYSPVFLKDIDGEKHIKSNDLSWTLIPLLDPGLLKPKPSLDYCYLTAVKCGDADRIVQALIQQEPYIFKELPPGPVTSADAFVLQIQVTPLKEEPLKLESSARAYYIPGVQPKDNDRKQIAASNLEADRALVMQSALMENIKKTVPGERSCSMLGPSPSQNHCPSVSLELALNESDLEQQHSKDFLSLTLEISQAVRDYRKRVDVQSKAPTPTPTSTRPAGKHLAGSRGPDKR